MRGGVWTGVGLVVLTACSDGGGGGSPETLDGYDAEFVRLTMEADGLDRTDTATLPATGSAEYEGVIRLNSAPGPFAPEPMVGALDMALDLGSGALRGEAGNFVRADAVALQGSLAVTGEVTRDARVEDDLVADIEGTLSVDPASLTDDLVVAGVLRGDLLGEDGQVARGDLSGVIGNPNASEAAPLSGDFIAAR